MKSPHYRVSPRRKYLLPFGDSISAKCEMDSPGGEDISRPLGKKVATLIKMSRFILKKLERFIF